MLKTLGLNFAPPKIEAERVFESMRQLASTTISASNGNGVNASAEMGIASDKEILMPLEDAFGK